MLYPFSSFKCPNNPFEFEWRSFLNKIEEVSKQLEKAPSLVPQVWKPLLQIDFEKEMKEEEKTNFNKGMQCLAKKVSQRRLEVRFNTNMLNWPVKQNSSLF